MTGHRVVLFSDGVQHFLSVDGRKIRAAGVSVWLQPGNPADVAIELHMPEVSLVGEQAEVHIPDETRQALLALGWTEPTS